MRVKSQEKLPPKIVASKLFDKSNLVELWLSTMTEADEHPEPKLEVRPARQGLGYEVSHKSNMALKDPIENMFRRETARQRERAEESVLAASRKDRNRDSIYEDAESRCEAFGKKKRAAPKTTTVLEQTKKGKKRSSK